jgi:Ni/Fe-hydrogenase subunit HybB-like protein
MHGLSNLIVSLFLILALYGGLLGVIVWGWVRWTRSKEPRTTSSLLSLLGLAFATASVLLAVASIWYGHAIGYSFSSPNPWLLSLINWSGTCLAVAATLTAVRGVQRSNPLRWQSLAGALTVLFLWLTAVTG